ncbi:MAG: hypothetical protein HC915_07630 [Anaerolineae bacterium]|nr:hypothetical protein [Anaerolineae bacterium]
MHPLVRRAFGLGLDLSLPVLAAEFDLDALLEHMRPGHPVRPLPTQPAVYQDMALIVPENTPAAQVEAVIREAGGDLLAEAHLFDVYQGEPIPPGKKSLAYALTYQDPEATLTDKQVSKLHQQIARAVEAALGAHLRG